VRWSLEFQVKGKSGLQREGLGLRTFGGRREGKADRESVWERLQWVVNREQKVERERFSLSVLAWDGRRPFSSSCELMFGRKN